MNIRKKAKVLYLHRGIEVQRIVKGISKIKRPPKPTEVRVIDWVRKRKTPFTTGDCALHTGIGQSYTAIILRIIEDSYVRYVGRDRAGNMVWERILR